LARGYRDDSPVHCGSWVVRRTNPLKIRDKKVCIRPLFVYDLMSGISFDSGRLMRNHLSFAFPVRRIVVLITAVLLATPLLYSATPTLTLPESIDLAFGAPLHIPLTASDADGDALSFSISVSDDAALGTFLPSGNRSLELNVADFGTMTFELFESRAPATTSRIIELTQDGFYDGIIFHRTINDFVIQAGDPTGTGRGGSDLGDFDDEFHVDLLHSGKGILSMAKAADDTNNSQFFISETATPHLDFNHSVFGLLTSGEDVRDAISDVAVIGDRPIDSVTIETARIIEDHQNGVLMLEALESIAGDITVSVTATDGTESVTSMIDVNIVEDVFNHPPFLSPFPSVLETGMNEELRFQLQATDIEGDEFIIQSGSLDERVVHEVSEDGWLSVLPPDDFVGELEIAVRVIPAGGFTGASDVQFFSVNVVPEPSANVLAWLCGGVSFLALRRKRV